MLKHALIGLSVLGLSSCATTSFNTIERDVAQKFMVDIRYFCANGVEQGKHCKQAVTELPEELRDMIQDTGIGGIVLFSENLETSEQIIRLNRDLQQAAKDADMAPLFIGVDQEGGRVMRLPAGVGTAFPGNMALGATYQQHQTRWAYQSAEITAKELKVLGFNTNFAPTVDVNVNPQNPVINVRSYGENPTVVARLGAAQVDAIQAEGVLAAVKHFPGHGDTSVDSHIGLPKVEHDRSKIDKVDLYPFKQAIETSQPAMVMTAHIQYPALDDTLFPTKQGEPTLLPATMSRKILTDVLRDELGFQGLIITDALDMAGIAKFFDKQAAVEQTFRAGTDVALMPINIRTPEDIQALKDMIKRTAQAYQNGTLNKQELAASLQRIKATKQKLNYFDKPLSEQIATAAKQLSDPRSKAVELDIASAAITQVTNNGMLPLTQAELSLDVLMPDTQKCAAFQQYLSTIKPAWTIHCHSLAIKAKQPAPAEFSGDVLIVADVSPRQSLAELGGMDDMDNWRERSDKDTQWNTMKAWMRQAQQQQAQTLFVSLRTPYAISEFAPLADATLASYAYRVRASEQNISSPSLRALAEAITGQFPLQGSLPVTVDME